MSRNLARRGFALLLALLVVTSGAVFPAAAASTTEECSTLDGFIYDSLSITGWFDLTEDNPCSADYRVDAAVEELQNLDANQTELDIYDSTSGQKASQEVYLTTVNNTLQDSQSVAWMKMQVAVAEAYQNGSSKAAARAAGQQAISDYYATKQKNLVQAWNVSMVTAESAHDAAVNESGISDKYIRPWGDEGMYNEGYEGINGFGTTTRTLVDGSSYGVRTVALSGGNSNWDQTFAIDTGMDTYNFDGTTEKMWGMEVSPPSGTNLSTMRYIDFRDWKSAWDNIETQNTNLQAESDNFVNVTYDAYENGSLNASDVISANTAMFEYGTRIGNESTLYSSTAALAMMGYEIPDLNSSGMMTVTYNTVEYQGLVLAKSAPNGTWETNTTYNASNISGPVFLASADGRKIDLTGEFTLTKMVAKDGTEIQSQNTTRVVYKTANTSELLAIQEELQNLRADVEAREASVGGGSSSDSGSGLSTEVMGGLILAGAAAVLLIQREGRQ